MPMSEAAMDGIRDNGRGWRFHLNGLIKAETRKLGEFNNRDGSEYDDEQVIVRRDESEPVVIAIKDKLRCWVEMAANPNNEKPLGEDAKRDIESQLDDLECVEDCSMSEINYAMDRLFDSLDYWRVLAG